MELWDAAGVPIEPRGRDSIVPLTAPQLSVWNDAKRRREGWRMCAASVRLGGTLDASLLQASVDLVAARHESLRTRFVESGGAPRQHVEPARRCQLEIVDLRGVLQSQVESQARRLAQEFIERKIDLSAGPLFEVLLVRLSDTEHALILAIDHMLSDAISFEILSREIWGHYELRAQTPASLPTLRLQFGDYAVWQQRGRQHWLSAHADYWRGRLAGARGVRLPPHARLESSQRPICTVRHWLYDRALTGQLRELARREQVRLPLVVLTICVAAVSRWCDQRDLVVGSVSHGRHHPDLASMLGFIANRVLLRIEIDGGTNCLDLLRQVEREAAAARAHRDYEWVPALVPECTTDLYFNWLPSSATFRWLPDNCTFTWLPDDQAGPAQTARASRCLLPKIKPFPLQTHWSSKFAPLFYDTGNAIALDVIYRPDLVATQTVERFARNFRVIAEQLLADPLRSLSSTEL